MTATEAHIRHNWTLDEAQALFNLSFADLLYQAQTVHRQYFDPNQIQLCTVMSIKTGLCPEDCGYCSQSQSANVELKLEKLQPLEEILSTAKEAKAKGATRFCAAAAWRNLPNSALKKIQTIIGEVKALGMESCMCLGMLTAEQAQALADAGLDYYNHNVNSSREFYPNVTTTHTYQDRLDTLEYVRNAGIKVCCGGILGLGESVTDRANMLIVLANLPEHPCSVPINYLTRVPGTRLGDNAPKLDNFDFIRTIAVARIMMPRAFVRLSAGRNEMSDEMQALCFQAGANSIHGARKVMLTKYVTNPDFDNDMYLFQRLGVALYTPPT
ncbi:MAG TPA: biotin synthase BioB [Gammaproteobacteria bacterium]|nr:biotin synthase BioB [Gammaproteobacteria bacterium]